MLLFLYYLQCLIYWAVLTFVLSFSNYFVMLSPQFRSKVRVHSILPRFHPVGYTGYVVVVTQIKGQPNALKLPLCAGPRKGAGPQGSIILHFCKRLFSRMDGICIIVAYNGEWTTNYKYLDHETKLILVNDEITFDGLVGKIFQVLKLKKGEIEANIWFDTKLETSKGMLVTNDDEVTTCIYLLKNDSSFKASRFIVDIAERNSLSANSSKTEICNYTAHEEEVNSVPQEEGLWEMHIGDKALIVVEPTMELATKEITQDTGQTSNGKKVKKRSTSKRGNLPTIVLREDASLDEIVVGSLFVNKGSLKKCFFNNAIKYHFKFKVDKSCKTRYYLNCYDEECNWYLHSSQVHDSALFKITKFEKTHSCSIDETDQRHATSKVISDYIIKLRHDTDEEIKPKFVIEEMRRRYGLSISYHKAWRAIQLALGVMITGVPEMADQSQTE